VTTPVVVTDSLLLLGIATMYYARGAEPKDRRRVVWLFLTIVGMWCVINAYWILPTIYYMNTEYLRGGAVGDAQTLMKLNSAPFLEAIRLGGYWGLSSGYKGSPYFPWSSFYTSGAGAVLGFALPVLGVAGIRGRPQPPKVAYCPACGAREKSLVRRGRLLECASCSQRSRLTQAADETTVHIWFFAVVLVVSLLLITGPNEPLGQVKGWVLCQSDLFVPFRSLYQRFGVYLAVAYAPLLASGIDFVGRLIGGRFAKTVQPRISKTVVAILIVLVVGVLAQPMLSGDLYNSSGVIPSNRITVQGEYVRTAAWLDEKEGDFLVLPFPYGPSQITALEWDDGQDGFLGPEPLGLLSSKPVLFGDPAVEYLSPLVAQASNGGERAQPALRLLNARYVVVHLDSNQSYLKGLPNWIGTDVEAVNRRLSSTNSLRLVRVDGQLRVYEVKRWKPFRLFVAERYNGGSIYAERYQDVRAIRYRSLGNSVYEVASDQLSASDTLVVNHPFDRMWEANEAEPRPIQPGLTGFSVDTEGDVVVRHRLQQQQPLLLTLVPMAFLLGGMTSFALWRRAKRSRTE